MVKTLIQLKKATKSLLKIKKIQRFTKRLLRNKKSQKLMKENFNMAVSLENDVVVLAEPTITLFQLQYMLHQLHISSVSGLEPFCFKHYLISGLTNCTNCSYNTCINIGENVTYMRCNRPWICQ